MRALGDSYALSRGFNAYAARRIADMPFMPMEDVATGMLTERCDAACGQEGWFFYADGLGRKQRRSGQCRVKVVTHHVKTVAHMTDLHCLLYLNCLSVERRRGAGSPTAGSAR